jgi:hypothetical protein
MKLPDYTLLSEAEWVWRVEPTGCNDYAEFAHAFEVAEDVSISRADGTLMISADSAYQVWLNGAMIGHGPAKSAGGQRAVDVYNVTHRLRAGQNTLLVLACNYGTHTSTYCVGPAGVCFRLSWNGGAIFSGTETLARKAAGPRANVPRRGALGFCEDFDAAAEPSEWAPVDIVSRPATLIERPVSHPARTPARPVRFMLADHARTPNAGVTFCYRPYLHASGADDGSEAAMIVSDILSAHEQSIITFPSPGLRWYLNGRPAFTDGHTEHALVVGANRLIGIHDWSVSDDVTLSMRTMQRVAWENPFGEGIGQVVPLPSTDMLPCGEVIVEPEWTDLEPWMPVMNEADGFAADGGGHELLMHSVHVGHLQAEPRPVSVLGGDGQGLVLESAGQATATRWIVDLGRMAYGWLRLDLTGSAGSTLVIGLAEAVSDGIPLEVHWVESSRNAITYRLRDGRQAFESFSAYAGRYLIVQHTGAAPVELHDLAVLSANCGTARDGSFRSSDAQLNAIYEICQNTVVAGSDDTYCNAPAYEQMNCAFDARAAAIADLLTCRNIDLSQHSLRLFADDPLRDGLVAASYPGPPGRAPALAAFNWIMWLDDYYWYTGDRDLVVDLFPAVTQGIKVALGQRSDIGLYIGPGHGDDAEDEFQPANGAEQAGFAGALSAAMDLASVVGGSAVNTVPVWEQAREKLILGVNAVLWDGSREAYADGLDGFGIPSMVSSQVTNALMCVHGIAGPERARELVRRISIDDTSMRPYASSFGLFAVLEAFDHVHALKPLFDRINRHWGEMVLSGDGTTWETVSMRHDGLFPTRAHCHPGSAFVAKYLLKYALGLEILKPGFAEIRIEPRMSKLDFCRGVVPTARGPIRVEWEKVDSRISIKVEHPATIIRRKSR